MTAPCPHDRTTESRTDAQVQHALHAAVARVAATGGRLTEPRRRVLELLLQAYGPVKAYDLVARFHADRRVAKPATIYRALEFLERMGLAHRLSTLKAYVACHRDLPAHSPAFLICECCGALREIPAPVATSLATAAAALGYTIDHITIEAEGRCQPCPLEKVE
ncbi:MAG: transcriptional repressor [Alphaproteobacteria bacterium]|nr:transcriptional repressor [Alphaproteobacteria bacterium]MBU4039575.1 transcriptional repressor [Alphaproteobacteria bacterium]MBU4137884.1 transcriptional repressor [Alphaproteobacteria bacterium]